MVDQQSDTTPPPRGVREVAPGIYRITSAPRPRGLFGRRWQRVKRLAMGPPIATEREGQERIGWSLAVALLGADMIASSVYGPEELLRQLALAGPRALGSAVPIAIAIVCLLAMLAISYWQTIRAYPGGAGGYVVASANLGQLLGLVSAAALLIDYGLDVAVSIASGVETATSAVPAAAPWKVPLALAALAVITLANLRGIRTAGMLFSVPVYVYIAGTLAVVGYGLSLWAGHHLPAYSPPGSARDMVAHPTEALGLLLLIRAFSSGAVALTGVEAVSNGVPYLKPPEARSGHRALVAMTVAFGALFLGIAFLSSQLGIVPDPTETETVHSQLIRTLVGNGPLHALLELAALILLVLAADTGFADFPRLLALLARDGYLPDAFAVRGSRLAFSNGVLLVAAFAAILIVGFAGSVAALVPLFTVGAFLTFTLSQAGMARHWWRDRPSGWYWRLGVNAAGAAGTALVLAIVLIGKFTSGAWIVVLTLPLLVLTLNSVGTHRRKLRERVRPGRGEPPTSIPISHRLLLPVGHADRVALFAAAYASSLVQREDRSTSASGASTSPPMEAVHVTDDPDAGRRLRSEWEALGSGLPLVVLETPYRAYAEALVRYIEFVQREEPGCVVTVVLPETTPTRWWHPLLRNYMAWKLKWMLLFRPRTAVLSVPLQVKD